MLTVEFGSVGSKSLPKKRPLNVGKNQSVKKEVLSFMTIIQGNYEKAIRYLNSTTKGFFEFVLPYVEIGERFREIDRFLWESKKSLRFQNEYTGNVFIDLSAFNNRPACEFNEYFDAFMYFLKSKKDKLSPLFFVNSKCSRPLFNQLSKFYELVILDPDQGEVTLSENQVKIGFRDRSE